MTVSFQLCPLGTFNINIDEMPFISWPHYLHDPGRNSPLQLRMICSLMVGPNGAFHCQSGVVLGCCNSTHTVGWTRRPSSLDCVCVFSETLKVFTLVPHWFDSNQAAACFSCFTKWSERHKNQALITTMNCHLTAPHLSLIHTLTLWFFLQMVLAWLLLGVTGPIRAWGRDLQSTTQRGALRSSKGRIINGGAGGK